MKSILKLKEATSAIVISNASIRVGGRLLLKEVNASINTGELIGVFGPNGAGKSTLMKALLGLISLSSGTISLFGRPPGSQNHHIGYMPQALNIPETTALSVRSLLTAVQQGKRWGIPWSSSVMRKEIDDVLNLAGVRAKAESSFYTLSGGEKQRVMLAQALLGKPSLLLLDEPLASLDPRNQMCLIESIEKIKETTGATILFIAHDINPLLGVMDRMLYVAGGSAAIGSVDEIVTSKKLSELYATEMHVEKIKGHLFIINTESGTLEKTTCHDCPH